MSKDLISTVEKQIRAFSKNKTKTVNEHETFLASLLSSISKAKKEDTKKFYESQIIEIFKPIFDAVPKLKMLPLYVWGRHRFIDTGRVFEEFYYKDDVDDYFLHFRDYHFRDYIEMDLSRLEDVNKFLLDGKFDDKEFYFDYKTVLKHYGCDDVGGTMLLMTKKNNKFKIILEDCSTNE